MRPLALSVSWTLRPRAVRLGFGVVVLERPLIVLRDRDDTVVFSALLREVAAAPYRNAMIELTPPSGGPFYITGFTGQQHRDRIARDLIERYEAVGLPSKSRDEREKLKQVWQPSTIELLRDCGAIVAG